MTKNIKIQIGEKHIIIKNFILEKIFLSFSFLVLISTTTYWTLLSTKVESFNSDQLSAPYVFSSFNQIMTSSLTGAHTYLLKWPLFWFIKSYSYAHWTYYLTTLFCVLVTVISLAYMVIKLEKRPIYSGSILLALSSVLLLIPAQSYPGSLLPLNMAMLTTRNIEYVLFIASIYLVFKSKKILSLPSFSSLFILILLFTSDQMFLAIGLGGSILAITVLLSKKHWKVLGDLDRWFWYSFASTVTSYILIGLLTSNKIFSKLASIGDSYFSFTSNIKAIYLGLFYSITGALSNFGANPAYFNVEIKKFPSDLTNSLFSSSLIPSLTNIAVVLFIIYSIYKLIVKKGYIDSESINNRVLLVLLFSSLSLFILFTFTNHYYAADGRNLGLLLFTGFISIANYSKLINIKQNVLKYTILVLSISVIVGLFSFNNIYQKQFNAFSENNRRDSIVVNELRSQKIPYIVGSYWRVYHIQYLFGSGINPYPTDLCINSSNSDFLRADLKSKTFGYLLSYDKNLTGQEGCQTDEIIKKIGNPNRSVVVNGNLSNPKELLLTYQHGANLNKINLEPNSTSTILPQDLSSVDFNCDLPNVLNIVAHEDDDLLFINPKIINDFASNRCIKTIYITAGNAGSGSLYWTQRQNGVENAYSSMIGYKGSWINRTVKLDSNEYLTIATPRLSSRAMLLFFNLPDGNLKGEGFRANDYQSIAKLYNGSIKSIGSVDKESIYTLNQLESRLEKLTNLIQPITIRTQSSFNSAMNADHSDHQIVSAIVSKMYSNYENDYLRNRFKIPIYYYVGYPVISMSPNLSADILLNKTQVFMEYAKSDALICANKFSCSGDLKYKKFLVRNYEYTY